MKRFNPVELAFYKGQTHLSDWLIQAVTRSPYSHVEMVIGTVTETTRICVSASGRDGGVRRRAISLHPDRWDLLPVLWAPSTSIDCMMAELGKPYDYLGLLGSQLLSLRRHQADRWFCSELCAHALGLGQPHRYAPGDLKQEVEERNALFETMRQTG